MSRKTVKRGRTGRNDNFKWYSDLLSDDKRRARVMVLAEIAKMKIPTPEISVSFRSRGEGWVRTVLRISPLSQLICPKNGTIVYSMRPQPQDNRLLWANAT